MQRFHSRLPPSSHRKNFTHSHHSKSCINHYYLKGSFLLKQWHESVSFVTQAAALGYLTSMWTIAYFLILNTHTHTHKPGCVHTQLCKNKGPRSHFIKKVLYPGAQFHSGCISSTRLHQHHNQRCALLTLPFPFSALCQTNADKKKIMMILICTLSPIAACTSNFPHVI